MPSTLRLVQPHVIKCLDFWQYNRWKIISLCSVLMYFSFFMKEYSTFWCKLVRIHSVASSRKVSLIWFKQQRRSKIHTKEKSMVVPRDRDTPWANDSKDVIRSGFSPSLCVVLSLFYSVSLHFPFPLVSPLVIAPGSTRLSSSWLHVWHRDLGLILGDFTCISCLSLGAEGCALAFVQAWVTGSNTLLPMHRSSKMALSICSYI